LAQAARFVEFGVSYSNATTLIGLNKVNLLV
jgi:hypothetical protein